MQRNRAEGHALNADTVSIQRCLINTDSPIYNLYHSSLMVKISFFPDGKNIILINLFSKGGHLTFECRNFVRQNPSQQVHLDISSTSSEEEEEEQDKEVVEKEGRGSHDDRGDVLNKSTKNKKSGGQ